MTRLNLGAIFFQIWRLHRHLSPRDDLGVVVLEAVDALRVLRAAVDALQVVLAAPPIVLYRFYVPAMARRGDKL